MIINYYETWENAGYKRGDIKIDINEDGTVMVIGGERPVEETVMVGWRLFKKGTETLKFKKSFRIPDAVVLDKIEAKFNEDESMLTVSMPKTVKGMVGTVIEEMEEPEIIRQESENLPVLPEESPQSPRKPERNLGEEHGQDSWEDEDEDPSQVHDKILLEKDSPDDQVHQETSLLQIQVVEEQNQGGSSAGTKQQIADEEDLPKSDEVWEHESDNIHEEVEDRRRREEEDEDDRKKCSILCAPIVAGSALLLSFVVFVIQCIRTKNQQPDKTNH